MEQNGIVDSEGVLTVKGCFSYVDDKGVTQKVCYIADKNGYRIAPLPIDSPPLLPRPYISSALLSSLSGQGLG